MFRIVIPSTVLRCEVYFIQADLRSPQFYHTQWAHFRCGLRAFATGYVSLALLTTFAIKLRAANSPCWYDKGRVVQAATTLPTGWARPSAQSVCIPAFGLSVFFQTINPELHQQAAQRCPSFASFRPLNCLFASCPISPCGAKRH